MDNSAARENTLLAAKPSEMTTLVITPFEQPDHRLVTAFIRAGALAFLDLGRDEQLALAALKNVRRQTNGPLGVRLPEGVSLSKRLLSEAGDNLVAVMHATPVGFEAVPGVLNVVQVVSLEEAQEAGRKGADALILKGAESGGRVGDQHTFILMQRVQQGVDLPFWVQGGMGPHGAAAAVLAGARGVVYDAQLALLDAAGTPSFLRSIISGVNGSETVVAGGYRFLRHKLLPDLDDDATRERVINELGNDKAPLLAGQDLALASLFQSLYKDPESLVYATEQAITGHLRQVRREPVFTEDSTFAREYGLRYPILQGPMTRVSDVPGFINAVSEGGAMPSFALAVQTAEKARPALEQTRTQLQGRSWSVGLLGFLPHELYQQQVALVREMAPSHVIIAGGRPDQAKAFEDEGIGAFLHCPSMRLFDRFVKDGARRFIFEGRECGGHVGPLSSMTLWEGQISLALESEQVAELSLVFSGGLHDQFSTAMLAAMCVPLVSLGAKVGLLMGTAYLFTEEAVREGAILPEYQRQALTSRETALIQTGPGHVTRCLRTPYVDFLNAARARLQAEGKSREELFMALEALNVGHLRIASKGQKRNGERLVEVGLETQKAEGMYMIGDVAGLRDRVTTIDALHREVLSATEMFETRPETPFMRRSDRSCDIAIVGMSGIFPGALTAEEYWANIIQGVDAVTEVPDDRWDKATYYDPDSIGAKGEKTNSKWGGFIPDFQFDPGKFGIPPQTLGSIDPAQIASLEVAYRALQDAGYLDRPFSRERTSCIFGVEPGGDLFGAYGMRIVLPQLLQGDALHQALDSFPNLTEDSFPGVLGNVVTGRISNRLDFGGQNFTIDAACASSLAAIDAAIKELRYGESDLAIAGGVDFHNGIHDYLMFSSTHALSKRGRCFTFSDSADGITLGEAAAAVVLKRYEDAVCDGDRVYAVIRGIGGASDGKSLGLTAPRKQGQQRALNRAYRRAGVSPAQIGMLEAHGTGTVVGDRTEMASLETVFSSAGSERGACALGSVKTQIGHTKCTSGVASLIKAAYSVKYGLLPPTLHIETPNAYYDKDRSSFYFLQHTRPWFTDDRKAGISAFGFGGTNYHTVIDRGDAEDARGDLEAPAVWPFELFLFRGATMAEARRQIDVLTNYLALGHQDRLSDIAFSHHDGGEGHGRVQIAVVARSREDLAAKLENAIAGQEDPRGVFLASQQPADGKVAFLFPGQGSQFLRMGADLLTYFPATRSLLADEPELRAAIFPKAAFTDEDRASQQAALTDTRMAQPALGVISLAASQVLSSLGIRAEHVVGHSYGELSALCYAGSIRRQDLTEVSRRRAQSIQDSLNGGDNGAMLAVEANGDRIRACLGDLGDLEIANLNAPNQTVLSGPTQAIIAAEKECRTAGLGARRLPVACAFHSRYLDGAAEQFKASLRDIELTAPGLAVWSNEHAEPYPIDLDANQLSESLGRQIRSTVRFVDIIQNLHDQAGVNTFVEVGAGSVLSGLTKNILAGRDGIQTMTVAPKDAAPLKGLMSTLGRLAVTGTEMDLAPLYQHRRVRALDLKHPDPLSKTTWLVNGQYARPLNGTLPAHAYDPRRQANIDLRTTSHANGPSGQVESREGAIKAYFDSLDRFIDSQRDVMLGYLGAAPSEPRPLAAPSARPAVMNTAEPMEAAATSAPVMVVNRETVEARLRALICARTGYPDDMLEADLDLEADLGIDSIKRVELLSEIGEELGLKTHSSTGELGEEATRFLEEVSRVKTLRGVTDWLVAFSERQAPAQSGVATEEVPSAAASTGTDYDQASIEARLVALICERTGYPEEMLEPELDLEADLGIDSIKRVELLSEIGDQLGLNTARSTQELGEEASAFLEDVSRLKTLRGISQWLAKTVAADGGPNESTEAAVSEPKREQVPSGTPFRVLNVLYHQKALTPDPKVNLNGRSFHVVGASRRVFETLTEAFRRDGLSLIELNPETLSEGDSLDTHGVIYFSHDQGHYDNITTLFRVLRACDPKQVDTVMVVQRDNEALLDAAECYQGPCSGSGLSGFLVSLSWEWPSVRMIRSLIAHDASELEPDALAERVRDEVLSQKETLAQPVAYHRGQRFVRKALPRPDSVTDPAALALNEDSTVVVIGGAKGITHWFAAAFAERYRCRLAIIGRSERPDEVDPWPTLHTAADIRQSLLSDPAQRALKPRDIEQRVNAILAEKQMRQNLRELETNGGEVTYLTADIMDRGQVDLALKQVVERYGRIDGVLLGAGILDDRFLKDKQEASIERVYNTKVAGVDNVLSSLERIGEPRFCVFFSSLSSTLGNRGQTDYSAANNYLDMRALSLNAQREGHYLSVNWGPWEGAGMIDATLQKHLEGMGVGSIKRQEGVDFLFRELGAGKGSGRLIAMCADDDALHWTE